MKSHSIAYSMLIVAFSFTPALACDGNAAANKSDTVVASKIIGNGRAPDGQVCKDAGGNSVDCPAARDLAMKAGSSGAVFQPASAEISEPAN